jgi:alginate O-acetyltransferase complex protein AlgI
MLFHTFTFLVFFTITVVLLLIARRKHTTQKNILLIASAIFYMWWNPAFILLIVFSAGVDYLVAARLEHTEEQRARRNLLLVSLITNFGLLAFFKYTGFLEHNLLYVFRLFGYQPNWADLHIILPVGISFYTFHTLSYTIDVYKREIPTTRSFRDFALFVTFFPPLVAGPIMRASSFLPQLETPRQMNFDRANFFLFLRGLVKKALVADGVALFADAIFKNTTQWSSAVIWLATICFYVQIYCDFSGYSDMAIAIARMLGYELTPNFNRPYFAADPSEFWKRWHISLSTWLRDYLYIPLGGNRHGELKTIRNLMLTMLIGGLWHGASWSFVLWGGLHGAALVVHRGWRSLTERWNLRPMLDGSLTYRIVSVLVMQYFILVTWIPFRLINTDQMIYALRKFIFFDMNFRLADAGLGAMAPFATVLLITIFMLIHLASEIWGGLDVHLARLPLPLAATACVLIGVVLFILWPSQAAPFIYFQF